MSNYSPQNKKTRDLQHRGRLEYAAGDFLSRLTPFGTRRFRATTRTTRATTETDRVRAMSQMCREPGDLRFWHNFCDRVHRLTFDSVRNAAGRDVTADGLYFMPCEKIAQFFVGVAREKLTEIFVASPKSQISLK
jgi:hypothetical protein